MDPEIVPDMESEVDTETDSQIVPNVESVEERADESVEENIDERVEESVDESVAEVVYVPLLGVKRKRGPDFDTPDSDIDELRDNISNNISNNVHLVDACVTFEQLPVAANIFSFSRVNVLHAFYKHPKLNAYVCHFNISVNEFTYKFEQIKRLDWVQHRPYFKIWDGKMRLTLYSKYLTIVQDDKEGTPQLIFKRVIGRLSADNVRLLIKEYLPESEICKLSLYRPSQPLD